MDGYFGAVLTELSKRFDLLEGDIHFDFHSWASFNLSSQEVACIAGSCECKITNHIEKSSCQIDQIWYFLLQFDEKIYLHNSLPIFATLSKILTKIFISCAVDG